MKKIICILLAAVSICFISTGCTEAERVSYNLSEQADNFNIVRQLTVINCIEGDVLSKRRISSDYLRGCMFCFAAVPWRHMVPN